MRKYQFTSSIPTKVIFGDGAISHLAASLAQYGKKVLLVYGGSSIKKTGLYDTVTAILKDNGFEWWDLPGVDPNPRIATVQKGGEMCREHGIEVVLAVGGGSVIDCSKGISTAAFYEGDAWDLAANPKLVKQALPLVVISTMAASGSEMDAGAVITNPAINVKGGIHGAILAPKVSILDPAYTYTVPNRQTAAGTADIFTHVIENYFDPVDDIYLSDCFAESILKTCVKYGPIALAEPDNFEARANLMWAAPWAMTALVSGGRATAPTLHGMQHPLGAYYDIIHGEGLAILMPHWFRYILSDSTVDRFAKYGVNVFGIDASLPKYEIANKAIEATEDFFFNKLGIPRILSEIGCDDKNLDDIAKQAVGRGNQYVPLSKEDMIKIYLAAM